MAILFFSLTSFLCFVSVFFVGVVYALPPELLSTRLQPVSDKQLDLQLYFDQPLFLKGTKHGGSIGKIGTLRCCDDAHLSREVEEKCLDIILYSAPTYTRITNSGSRPLYLPYLEEGLEPAHFSRNELRAKLRFSGNERFSAEAFRNFLPDCQLKLDSDIGNSQRESVETKKSVVLRTTFSPVAGLFGISTHALPSEDYSMTDVEARAGAMWHDEDGDEDGDEDEDQDEDEDDEEEDYEDEDYDDSDENDDDLFGSVVDAHGINKHLHNYVTEHYGHHLRYSFSFIQKDFVQNYSNNPDESPEGENRSLSGERLCENSPSSSVCDAVRQKWANDAQNMWPALSGLSSANTTAHTNEPFRSQHPFRCINHDLKSILPFQDYGAGDVSKLRKEVADGTGAAVIGSMLSNFAMASNKGQRVEIRPLSAPGSSFTSTPRARIVISRSLHARQFLTGDFIALHGFASAENVGSFQVANVIDDTTLEIKNIDQGSFRAGKVQNLRYETNGWGAQIVGCWSRGTSSDPDARLINAISITIYGNKAGSEAAWVKYSREGLADRNLFQIGELVRLKGFALEQNNGLFRVEGIPGNGIIRLGNVAPCKFNSKCTNERVGSAMTPTVAKKGVFGVARNNFMAKPIMDHIRLCQSCNGHGTCIPQNTSGGICQCHSSWVGETCSLPALPCPLNCSGNGFCDREFGKCHCSLSWTGIACAESVLPCPNSCSGHGVCSHKSGHCACDSTWCGIDCAVPCVSCPDQCNGHGQCNVESSTCFCEPSWGGIDCAVSTESCPSGCSGNGRCEHSTGKCYCDKGFHGIACDRCGKHARGKAGHNGTCVCEETWAGKNCERSSMACPSAKLGLQCSGHGTCDALTGSCSCSSPWGGLDCAYPKVLCPPCGTGHGVCDFNVGKWICDAGYSGKCCEAKDCPGSCSGPSHGYCDKVTRKCRCHRAWKGDDCSVPRCGRHGSMLPDGSCHGDPGWYAPVKGGICDRIGDLCKPDIKCISHKGSVYDTCNNHASGCSANGACMCDVGYAGISCNQAVEPTGEQIQPSVAKIMAKPCPIVDLEMKVRLSAFLVYTSSRVVLGKHITTDELLTVFRARGKAIESEGAIRARARHIMRVADVDRDGKLCANEFLYALIQPGKAFASLVPSAFAYAYSQLDVDGDGQATFVDLLWAALTNIAMKKIIDENLKVGKNLPGTFTIKKESSIAVGTLDQTAGEEQRRLWEKGGNIMQLGSKTFVTLRVFDKVNVELNEPWTDADIESAPGRVITRYTLLEVLGIPLIEMALINKANSEDPPLVANKHYLQAWKDTDKLWKKFRSKDALERSLERATSISVDQYITEAANVPDIVCLRSPYCADVLNSGGCLKSLCKKFCLSSSLQAGNMCVADAPLDWESYSVYMRSLRCVRKYWGQAKALRQQSGIKNVNKRLSALLRLEQYIAKTLIETPTAEALKLKSEFEKEKACALKERNTTLSNRPRDEEESCSIADMDSSIFAAQLVLAKQAVSAEEDLSDDDDHCTAKINFATLWKERDFRFMKAKARMKNPHLFPGFTSAPNHDDNDLGGAPQNKHNQEEVCGSDELAGDGCCDNCDQENIQVCPTADPKANDLIQMCTCGNTGIGEEFAADIDGAGASVSKILCLSWTKLCNDASTDEIVGDSNKAPGDTPVSGSDSPSDQPGSDSPKGEPDSSKPNKGKDTPNNGKGRASEKTNPNRGASAGSPGAVASAKAPPAPANGSPDSKKAVVGVAAAALATAALSASGAPLSQAGIANAPAAGSPATPASSAVAPGQKLPGETANAPAAGSPATPPSSAVAPGQKLPGETGKAMEDNNEVGTANSQFSDGGQYNSASPSIAALAGETKDGDAKGRKGAQADKKTADKDTPKTPETKRDHGGMTESKDGSASPTPPGEKEGGGGLSGTLGVGKIPVTDANGKIVDTTELGPPGARVASTNGAKRPHVGHYVNPGSWFNNLKFSRLNSTIQGEKRKKRRRRLLHAMGGPGKGQSDVVNSFVKKTVYNGVKEDMSTFLTAAVYENLRPELSNHMIAALKDATMESVRAALGRDLVKSVGNNVAITTTQGVKGVMSTTMPRQLFTSETIAITKTLTRALVHALCPAIISTLSATPAQRHHCYLCKSHGISEECSACDAHTTIATESALHYANFYAAYYSDYYADYYTKEFFGQSGEMETKLNL